jgi:UDP-N-acetyl-D-mannosaminuronic acid dehydrogenase
VTSHSDEIVVIGQGFVGLTLSVFIATKGLKVHGIEANSEILDKLRSGKAHFFERDLNQSLSNVLTNGFLTLHKNLPKRNPRVSRIYIITVGTPLIDGSLSTAAYENAISEIYSQVRSGDCVVTRSTVGIGITRRFVQAPLIEMGLEVDVVVAPERTIEGVALNELAELTQIIGGDEASTRRIQRFFQGIGVDTVILDDLEGAEFAKLMSNSFRDLLFGVSNEYAMLADHLGLNFTEILEKSKKDYGRLSALAQPGPVAGPCLSKDPKIFYQSAKALGFDMKITESSREQNEHLAKHLVQNIFRGSSYRKIGVIGLAFKGIPETDDTRDSFANLILREIATTHPGCNVKLWDPLGSKLYEEYLHGAEYAKISDIIENSDLIVIQNSNPYFSSDEFIWELNQRVKPEKLIVYQLWNSLPIGSSHAFEVRSLSNFNHEARRVNQ